MPNPPARRRPARGAEPGKAGPSKTPSLDQYTIDFTARAWAGQIDPVLGRESEVRQMVDILMRRRQNNPILTGEAGVGKTAVVEGFASRIAEGDVLAAAATWLSARSTLGPLQAGAGVRGEFENRLKGVLAEVKASPRRSSLFIDEAHTLITEAPAARRGRGRRQHACRPQARGEPARSPRPPGPSTRNISKRTPPCPGGFRSSRWTSRPRTSPCG
ncbi:MAG: AAA family ATPase [Isosphaeraceae bacterium]